MKKPIPSDDKENAHPKFEHRGKAKDRKRSEVRSPDTKRTCVKDLVYKDVYLMDRSVGRFDKNLLANSLTAKLKQNIPGELSIKMQVMNKLRRENLKDYVHLENLNKKYDTEMQMHSNKLDNEGTLLLRRHERMRKQSEYQRKNQEKIRSQIRNTAMKQPDSSSSVFPQIKHFSQAHAVSQPPDESTVELHPSVQFEASTAHASNFQPFSVDTSDQSNVKVFKYRGIFQPQNKYSARRHSQRSSATGGILKRDVQTPEYQILTLSLDDNDDRLSKSRSEKKRKGLRVTWSGVERDMEKVQINSEDLLSNDDSENNREGSSTPSTVKSVKSDPGNHQRQSKRNKIENIGIKWKLPPGSKQTVRAVKSATASYATNPRSRNLVPVSSALNQSGMSVTRTRWHVPSAPPLSSYDLYRQWLHKLDKVKCPVEPKPFLQDVSKMDNSCAAAYSLPATLSEPVNLSIYAASNVV